MSASELSAQTRMILDDTVRELERSRLSGPSKLIARTVLKALKGRSEYDDVISQVLRLEREIEEISTVLANCAEQLRAAERAEADRDPEGKAWWNQRLRRVSTAFDAGDPRARDVWVETWMEFLERNAWQQTIDLATQLTGRPGAAAISNDLVAVPRALAADDPSAALESIERLIETGIGGVGVTTRLGLLRVRVLLSEFSNRAVVRAAAMQAVNTAEGTPHESLALAALAEAQLANDSTAVALQTLGQATSFDTPATDARVLLGEVLERDAAWAKADLQYERALAGDQFAALPVLLRRVPSRLLVRAALRDEVPPDRAVDMLTRALDLGVPGDGDYPDKDVWAAKGDRLVERAAREERDRDATAAIGSRAKAAEAYFYAGQRYAWLGFLPRAVELFAASCAHAPEVAEYRWQHAETIRLTAYRSDGVVDRDRLERARAQLLLGIEHRRPSQYDAWVLITQSKIDEDLGIADPDPTLTIERALLLDPEYAPGYSFLASALRRQGFVVEAREVIEQGMASADDDFAFNIRVALELDAGHYGAALDVIDQRAEGSPEDPELRLLRSNVLLRMGDPEGALRELEEEKGEMVRATRGLALATAGRRDEARDEFLSLWRETRHAKTGEYAGWAAYAAGLQEPFKPELIDEAVDRYRELAERAPTDLQYLRDLGQMLLARGDAAEGRAALEDGIEACPYPDELVQLAGLELPMLRAALVDRPYAAFVARIVDSLGDRIEHRVALLRRRRRDPGSAAVEAAAARTALGGGDAAAALAAYRRWTGSLDLPEAPGGAIRAALLLRGTADAAYTRGERDSARAQWAMIQHQLEEVPGSRTVSASLTCRQLLVDVMRAPYGADGWLDREQQTGDEAILSSLSEAVDVVVHDPDSLWALHDGLVRLRGDQRASASLRSTLDRLLDELPLERIYSLAADKAVDYASFVSVRQLEMHVAGDVADQLENGHLDDAVQAFSRRVLAETGVRIPWVYHERRPDLPAGQVDVRVYGRWVASSVLGGEPEAWVEEIVACLDRTVRGHLFRLVGVDDVTLWLEGWDLQHRDAPEWRPSDPVVDRLRLARLLRMLLREGVSVADRHSIIDGLDASATPHRARPSATLDTLRDVRSRLGPTALGIRPGVERVLLPKDLEARLRSALRDDRPVWELPRPAACSVIADLRAWLEQQPKKPVVLVVDDGRLRPFVWRLLATEPSLAVISKEELA